MKYGITAASSHYGSTVIQTMLSAGVDEQNIVAYARHPKNLDVLERRGVTVRDLDYAHDFAGKFDGVDRLMYIPTRDSSRRDAVAQRLIAEAERAGVQDFVYISFINADRFPDNPLTPDHRATEQLMDASAMNTLALRSGYYTENILESLPSYLSRGVLPSTSRDGKMSLASRDEMAQAAAKLFIAPTFETGVKTFAGAAYSKADVARILSDATGANIVVKELEPADYYAALVEGGMPEAAAKVYTGVDVAVRRGAHYTESTDLATVLGRNPRSFEDSVQAWARTQHNGTETAR